MLQTIKTSKYDWADRRIEVVQPDAGKSTFKFDALGNLLERQTANLEAKSKKITYEYEFNRLTNIHYPENPQNDVRYVFGSKNESQNRKGRLILMEDATGAQEFSYGVMGEIESIRRTVIVPNSAVATYVTSWKYDSWNRLQEMIYPDQEKISYTYNSGGLLQAVAGKKAYSYNYVNKIGYDKFEQRSYLKYCNGTETKYNYEPLRRRLDNMTVASGTGYQGTNTPRMFMNNNYQYDKVSNVLNVTNSAAGVTNKMGGIMAHNYSYDNLYQLTSANGVYTGADQKTANYNLEMKYDDLHNIVSKTQNVMQNKVTETGALKAGYTLNYNYNGTNKHQLDNVTETEYRTKNADPKVDKQKNNKYVYDKNGNMIYVNTEEVKLNGQVAEKAQEKKFIWDEENRLGAIDINGYVSNYTYDAGGERITKMSGGGQGIFVNSVFAGGKTSTSDFTLYVNPYLVAQNGGRYTKHIYIGSQRIVSKLGDFDSYGADPRRLEKAGESFSGVKVNYDAKYKKSLEIVKSNYDTFEVPYYGLDNNDYVNGIGFCCNPSGESSSSSSSSSSTTGKLMTGKNDNAELQQFYYHPDHLGSSSYISNLDGEVVQHVEYVPFGEVFLEEKNAKWNTPYLFTSKELDKETGMYYFGARYQDPKLGLFISVDPMAEEYKGWSSYAYGLNNPIKFIDPSGMNATDYVDENGNMLLHTNDGSNAVITVAKGKEDAFAKSVQGTKNKDLLDTKEWNFTAKNYLVGNWSQWAENTQSWYTTAEARKNVVLFWQTGNYDYWDKANSEHLSTFRKDIFAWAISIAGGALGAAETAGINSVDDVMARPWALERKSYTNIRGKLENSEGWVNSIMTKTRGEDKGWGLRQVNENGQPTGKLIQYHPGSRRHYQGKPYWKVSDGVETNRFKARL